MDRPIAIVGGTGALGHGLALRWALAGHAVAIGSREPDRAAEAAARLREAAAGAAPSPGAVSAGSYAEVAAAADVVVLTVPFRAQSENLQNLRDHLRPGQILVDCTVPLAAAVSGRATRSLGVWQGSAAEQAAEMTPDGMPVVAGFHTLSAPRLADPAAELAEDVLLCGDDAGAKATVAELVRAIDGLRPVDAGPLEAARLAEQLAPLLIGVNARYRARAGVRLTGLEAAARDPWEAAP